MLFWSPNGTIEPRGRLLSTWWESGREVDEVGEEAGFVRALLVEEEEAPAVSFSAHRRDRFADEDEPIDSEGEVGETGEVAEEKDGRRANVGGRAAVVAARGGREAVAASGGSSPCFLTSSSSSSSSSS